MEGDRTVKLTRVRCTNCGAEFENVSENQRLFKCRRKGCGATFLVEQGRRFSDVEQQRANDIQKLRAGLRASLSPFNVLAARIYAQQILAIMPDDFRACAVLYLCQALSGNPLALRGLLAGELGCPEDEFVEVFPALLERCEYRELLVLEGAVKRKLASEARVECLKAIERRKEQIFRQEDMWADVPRDVFVCFSGIDEERALRAVAALEEDGNTCWISSRNMRPDEPEYWPRIERAISRCRVFLVMCSEAAMMSRDVQHELSIAEKLSDVRRLEVKLDGRAHTTLFKNFFDGITWVDATAGLEGALEQLKRRVYAELKRTPAPAPAITPAPAIKVERTPEPAPAIEVERALEPAPQVEPVVEPQPEPKPERSPDGQASDNRYQEMQKQREQQQRERQQQIQKLREQREQEKREQERREQERREQEKREQEKREQEKREREKREQEKREQEKREQEKREQEKRAKELQEQRDQQQRERQQQIQKLREQREQERREQEKREQEKREQEKREQEKREQEKREQEKREQEKREQEKREQEKREQEKREQEKREQEQRAKELQEQREQEQRRRQQQMERLQEQLKQEPPTPEPAPSPEPKADDLVDVFICYNAANYVDAQQINAKLRERGYTCFLSSHDKKAKDDLYWSIVEPKIGSCRLFMLLSSKTAMYNSSLHREMDMAVSHGRTKIELRMDKSLHTKRFDEFFAGAVSIDASDGLSDDALVRLLKAVQDILNPPAPQVQVSENKRYERQVPEQERHELLKRVQSLIDDVDVFISCAESDYDKAKQVLAELEEHGHSCFLSSHANGKTEDSFYWENVLPLISKCRVFVVLSSNEAMVNGDVINEMNRAGEHDLTRIELRLDDVKPTSRFKKYFKDAVSIDASVNLYDALVELVRQVNEALHIWSNDSEAAQKEPDTDIDWFSELESILDTTESNPSPVTTQPPRPSPEIKPPEPKLQPPEPKPKADVKGPRLTIGEYFVLALLFVPAIGSIQLIGDGISNLMADAPNLRALELWQLIGHIWPACGLVIAADLSVMYMHERKLFALICTVVINAAALYIKFGGDWHVPIAGAGVYWVLLGVLAMIIALAMYSMHCFKRDARAQSAGRNAGEVR